MFPKFNNSSVISHSTQARAKTAAPVLTAAGKEGPVPAAAATVLLPPASQTATRLRAQGGQNRNVCLSWVEPVTSFQRELLRRGKPGQSIKPELHLSTDKSPTQPFTIRERSKRPPLAATGGATAEAGADFSP